MTALTIVNDTSELDELRGQLAVFRGLAQECLALIGTLEPESVDEEVAFFMLTEKLEKAIDGNLVCPLFLMDNVKGLQL